MFTLPSSSNIIKIAWANKIKEEKVYLRQQNYAPWFRNVQKVVCLLARFLLNLEDYFRDKKKLPVPTKNHSV